MSLSAFAEFLADDALETPPIPSTKHPEGRVYRIPSPDAATGLRLTALANLGYAVASGQEVTPEDAARLRMDDAAEQEFLPQVLGSAYQELLDDGVSWVRIQRVGRYAFAHFALSPEAAVKVAQSAASSGEAPAPNRAARRAKTASPPASSATDRPTPRRGSNAGTTSRKKPRSSA